MVPAGAPSAMASWQAITAPPSCRCFVCHKLSKQSCWAGLKRLDLAALLQHQMPHTAMHSGCQIQTSSGNCHVLQSSRYRCHRRLCCTVFKCCGAAAVRFEATSPLIILTSVGSLQVLLLSPFPLRASRSHIHTPLLRGVPAASRAAINKFLAERDGTNLVLKSCC